MASRFDDQVVWITGARSGLGWALALEFARQGAQLALSARRIDRLQSLVAQIEQLGRKAIAIACDMSVESAVREAADAVVAHFGKLDVAVANAGIGVSGRIEKLDAAAWRRQLDTNVIGLAQTARYALPHLRASHGRLVLIGSVAAVLPGPGTGAYAASKAAVRSIGESLTVECAGSGVAVTTIHPGFVASEIARVDNHGRFDENLADNRPAKLIWPAERAARVMLRAIERRKGDYVFTGHGRIGAFMGQHFPTITQSIISKVYSQRTRRAPAE